MLRYRKLDHQSARSGSNETEIYEPDFTGFNSTEIQNSGNSSFPDEVRLNETGFNTDSVKLLRCNVVLMNHKLNDNAIRRSGNASGDDSPKIISYSTSNNNNNNKKGDNNSNNNKGDNNNNNNNRSDNNNSNNRSDHDFVVVSTNHSYGEMGASANGNFLLEGLNI